MEKNGLVLIVTTALLWGSTDALIKLFTPPKFKNQRREYNSSLKDSVYSLLEDFVALVASPGYLICQVIF